MKIIKQIILVCLIALANPVFAQSTGWLENPNHPPVKARFMLTGELDKATNTMPGVLEVELDGEWKTYWRSPGEGGIAPSIDWSGSTNLDNVNWNWPAPEQFSLLGLQTFGYHQQAAFPMLVTLNDASKPASLQGKFTLSSCTNICVLTDYDINLEIDPRELNSDVGAMFSYNKALSKVPQKKISDTLVFGWDAKAKQLQVEMDDTGWIMPKFIVDGEPDTTFKFVIFERFETDTAAKKLRAVFDASSWLGEPELLGKPLNLTVIDSNRAVEYTSKVEATTIKSSQTSLLKMLLIALLGGLILNVMPCVLPVLGMKLSAVIAAPDLQRRQIRQQFIASALGILVSFWLLAAFIFTLKLTGQAIGWGVQFQNPWFIGFMAIVTSVFALNMLGAFEITLPSNLQTKLATTGGNDHRGHFLQGMFATLLATPCSAPFLGTAVAFALGADVLSLFVIFTALALGMALPWLVVAAFPQVANYFPKPGRWMNVVKVVFSGLLVLTSLWLISLLANFIPTVYLWIAAAILLLLFLMLMAKVQGKAAVIASVSIGIMVLAVAAFSTSNRWAQPLPTDLDWRALNESEIARQVAAGKTVFVDVTADWCITCKANKVGVILQDPVYSELKTENIVLMEGDWTKPSAPITEYLQSHNRFGVPFNVVYGPNAPEGIALPVILSASDVIDAINVASVRF
ncbi:cytochrome c biogenesis protein transmembrane region [Shewanella halifaxensis HAW-EB4]|uniref:Cytochrome c biogenesis protein transmembrane region n=1 Tax=Shewanella halifaxensis (strain HAW-EB4) TaxID=458817 RepID=B0TRR6_SHEHH|nr:protein-disulfide reductase DsbD domain-containing protein [Shewanella halifaxensis]ABZ77828.1 cytochrome c biogenesis protein transmembrane region [Shewanella halifaxensis HAW-EB4]